MFASLNDGQTFVAQVVVKRLSNSRPVLDDIVQPYNCAVVQLDGGAEPQLRQHDQQVLVFLGHLGHVQEHVEPDELAVDVVQEETEGEVGHVETLCLTGVVEVVMFPVGRLYFSALLLMKSLNSC